ncbi:MAG: L-2-amino-thiazoline-4-carboxylic acid hydrolase, partial [Deltaproteobacteria bacterium]|nr:L-2-amino-thiazoline-4-carboxylic acid hydrolase [Deltaproteobacteria bacterium]
MGKKDETISLEEAKAEVGKAVRRIALVHLAFAETIVKELGEEAGKTLIVKAMRNYGMKIGGKARREALEKGLPLTPDSFMKVPGEPIPSIGTHSSIDISEKNGETVIRATDCLWAKVWKEYGGEELGRLYCLIDPAQFMSFNPEIKYVH